MKVCLNSGDVQIKHVRTTYDGQITGLVDGFSGSFATGYHYRLREEGEEEFLAELVEIEDEGEKTRVTFEK